MPNWASPFSLLNKTLMLRSRSPISLTLWRAVASSIMAAQLNCDRIRTFRNSILAAQIKRDSKAIVRSNNIGASAAGGADRVARNQRVNVALRRLNRAQHGDAVGTRRRIVRPGRPEWCRKDGLAQLHQWCLSADARHDFRRRSGSHDHPGP